MKILPRSRIEARHGCITPTPPRPINQWKYKWKLNSGARRASEETSKITFRSKRHGRHYPQHNHQWKRKGKPSSRARRADEGTPRIQNKRQVGLIPTPPHPTLLKSARLHVQFLTREKLGDTRYWSKQQMLHDIHKLFRLFCQTSLSVTRVSGSKP